MRASTPAGLGRRARPGELEAIPQERGLEIVASYVETVSGAKLERPELFSLLRDCHKGDVLLIEQVDRLSRLTSADWAKLKAEIVRKHVRIVALDLPTSYMFVEADAESFTARMADTINAMLLDILAAVARKDYDDRRRRRQAQGQARVKAKGRYKGRPENVKRNEAIAGMLRRGSSWSEVQHATGCSRATIAKIAKRMKAALASNQSEHSRRPHRFPSG